MSRSSELARAPVTLGVTKKFSPTTLRNIVKWANQMPVIRVICERARIHRSSLAYWVKKSEAGDPGFDVTIDGETRRFHEWFHDAMNDAVDRIEEAAFKLAGGTHKEVLVFKGRVQYQEDPDLVALGFEGSEAWLRDENGRPIPETIDKLDPDMTRFILKAHRPEKYVATQKIDVKHSGGVLVVGTQMKREDFEKKFVEKTAEQKAIDVEFEVVDDDKTADPAA